MQLYFSPLACSMATRIALYEAGGDAAYTEVDPATKRTLDGADFYAVNPLGLVPTLRTDAGELLTENAAILQYVAGQHPALEAGVDRTRLQQWLCFIGTELHKAVFAPLLDPEAPDAVKTYTLAKVAPRFTYLSSHLATRDYLVGPFSVADAYLVTVLNWTQATPIKLADWPVLAAYAARVRARPAVARALHEEVALYVAEQARHKTA
jgi:glutathione S-transferase